MVASLPSAYPYRADKLTVVGQGIDTGLFAPGGREDDPPLLLCVGRLSPIKDHATLIEAAARLHASGARLRLAVVGGAAGPHDEAYVRALRQQVQDRGLASLVDWAGPLPPRALPEWYRRCAAHVNLTRTGSGDKSVLEAMSCARPSLVANQGFRELLGPHADRLSFPERDADALASRLQDLLRAGAGERAAIGADLRERVVRHHALDRLADRLLALLRELAASKRRANAA